MPFELDPQVRAQVRLEPRPGVWSPSVFGWRIARFLSNIDFQGKRVLDIGTGSGLLAIVAALRGADVKVSDIAAEAVEAACANARASGVAVEGRVGPGFAPWVGHAFDVIICNAPGVEETPWGGLRFRPIPPLTHGVLVDHRQVLAPGGRIIGLAVGPYAADAARTAMLRADLEPEIIWATNDEGTAEELGSHDARTLLASGIADQLADGRLRMASALFCALRPETPFAAAGFQGA
jgi:SAM-dependent methyltransferase